MHDYNFIHEYLDLVEKYNLAFKFEGMVELLYLKDHEVQEHIDLVLEDTEVDLYYEYQEEKQ